MNPRNVVDSPQTRLLAAVLLLLVGTPAVVGAASEAPGGQPSRGTATIATGTDQSVDGFLSVAPDDFGQWASVGFGGGGDIFNPTGAAAPLEATFTSALFLFVPSRSQRTVLTENASHLGVASDGSVTLMVTSPSVPSDTNADTVDDTLVSSFTATGAGGTSLSFDLTQSVAAGDPGVATLTQEYVITNNDTASIDLVLDRVFDGDLLWAGMPGNEFSNDEVGTGFNAAGGDMFVFEQEPGDPTTAITLSSPGGVAYFGGKNGVLPAGGPPPYNFGTDTEVFDNFGFPASWINHIAGVGYDTDGVSGPTPAGSTPPEDGFIGLCVGQLTLGPSESVTVTVRHTYGQNLPPEGPRPPIVEIPTLSSAGLVALILALAVIGGLIVRRRLA